MTSDLRAAASDASDYRSRLEAVIDNTIAPAAGEVDRTGAFPRPAVDALGPAGVVPRGRSRFRGGPGGRVRRPARTDRGTALGRRGACRRPVARGDRTAAVRALGLAARGALVEAGCPAPAFDLDDRDVVWADLAPRLYAHAAALQWDPATAVPWDADVGLAVDIEAAVVQVMTCNFM